MTDPNVFIPTGILAIITTSETHIMGSAVLMSLYETLERSGGLRLLPMLAPRLPWHLSQLLPVPAILRRTAVLVSCDCAKQLSLTLLSYLLGASWTPARHCEGDTLGDAMRDFTCPSPKEGKGRLQAEEAYIFHPMLNIRRPATGNGCVIKAVARGDTR
jgi:hypothetical protein